MLTASNVTYGICALICLGLSQIPYQGGVKVLLFKQLSAENRQPYELRRATFFGLRRDVYPGTLLGKDPSTGSWGLESNYEELVTVRPVVFRTFRGDWHTVPLWSVPGWDRSKDRCSRGVSPAELKKLSKGQRFFWWLFDYSLPGDLAKFVAMFLLFGVSANGILVKLYDTWMATFAPERPKMTYLGADDKPSAPGGTVGRPPPPDLA